MHSLWTWCISYVHFIGICMIGLGIFLMLQGGRQYKVSMFISGLMAVVVIMMLTVFVLIMPVDTPMWTVWMCLFVSAGIGSGVGYAAATWSRVGVLIISAWVGALMGMLLYNLVITYLVDQN